jgi:hypothetical protein
MNIVEMLLNYLDFFKIILFLAVILIIFVTFLLLLWQSSLLNVKPIKNKNIIMSLEKKKIEKNNNKQFDDIKVKEKINKVEIKGFYKNEISENRNKFILSDKSENIDIITNKLIENKNNINNKNEELSIMFIESLSSLNSWKNNEIENQLFKEINWNLEKRQNENDEEESLVYQYVFPQSKPKNNTSCVTIPILSSSQSSINTNYDYEDEEEQKEKELLSAYKLGICRTFDYSEENKLKSNIVKAINEKYFKVYSQGEPDLIKEKCRKETIPENYNEMVDKYKKEGYNIVGVSGKKMKINYVQSQRIERNKCESNMIFLGFAVYKVTFDNYKDAYS